MKIAEYNEMMAYLLRPATGDRENFAIGGGQFEGTDLGTREGFEKLNQVGNLQTRLNAYENLKEIYGKELVENTFKEDHGISFEEIASKKTHNGRKVTNIIDGFKKKITKYKNPNKINYSAERKPYPDDIENRIIELHQNDKMGAEAIADTLTEEFDGNFSRGPVGKRIKALTKEGKIKAVPYKKRKASIDQRGDFYNRPAGEKYLAVRKVRDIDRTTKNRVGPQAGQLKYNIPKWAKFKVDFKNPGVSGAAVSDIPEDFRGIRYFKTESAAKKAVEKRINLKLREDVDPDEARRSANKKKYDLVKEVSDNNIERILADFKPGQPIEQAHRLSLKQVQATGKLYNVMNLGLDFDDPDFVEINNSSVKPYENKLKQLYTEQNKLYKKASKLKDIPKELRKQIEFNNKKISVVVDLSGGRVQGIQLNEKTLKPIVAGINYAKVLGFGLYDKPVKELTDVDRAGIGAIIQGQIENEIRTAGATATRLFENEQFLNDVDKLAVKSMVPGMKTADQIDRPKFAKEKTMFDDFGSRTSANPFFDPQVLKQGALDTLKVLGTPTVAAGFAGSTIKRNLDEGQSLLDAATDKMVGVDLLYPELAKQTVGKFAKPAGKGILSTLGRVAMNPFGRAARAFTPVGAGITAIGVGKDYYDFAKDEIAKVKAMTPEERDFYNDLLMDEGGLLD